MVCELRRRFDGTANREFKERISLAPVMQVMLGKCPYLDYMLFWTERG